MTFAGLASILLAATHPHPSGPEQAADRFLVTDTIFGYTVTSSQDADTAAREGEAAYSAAKSVLALSDVRFVIADAGSEFPEWGRLSDDGAVVYPWVFRSSAGSQVPGPPDYVLRHEIGHDLFIRYLVPSTRKGQYGGDAPDWLDEMAAVAFEGAEQQAARRRAVALYHREGRLLPLHTFLTMTHPELTGELPDATSGELFRVRQMTSEDTPQFYSMAMAFYEFLVARTGTPSIVADLAAAVRRGEPLDRLLLARTGHGTEASVETLNGDFLAWIATDHRYGESTLRNN